MIDRVAAAVSFVAALIWFGAVAVSLMRGGDDALQYLSMALLCQIVGLLLQDRAERSQ